MSEYTESDIVIAARRIGKTRSEFFEMQQEIGEQSLTTWITTTLDISLNECTPNAPDGSVKEEDAMIPFRNPISLEEALHTPVEYWSDEVYNRFFIVNANRDYFTIAMPWLRDNWRMLIAAIRETAKN
jgi:hypothetical protein